VRHNSFKLLLNLLSNGYKTFFSNNIKYYAFYIILLDTYIMVPTYLI
jgi:hypothetical protein